MGTGRRTAWAEAELGGAELGDPRRTRRAVEIAGARQRRPEAGLPESLGNASEVKAGYRFYESEEIEASKIMESHSQKAVERAKAGGEEYILAIQDTMHVETGGQDTWVHSTLLASPKRVPYGLIGQKVWERAANVGNKKKTRKKKATREKESHKWVTGIQISAVAQAQLNEGQHVVCVADRESDVFDAFAQAQKEALKMLIRATQDRCIAEDETRKLWDYVTEQPPSGSMRVQIQRNSDRAAREAVCTLRYVKVTLQPPKNRAKSEQLIPIEVVALHVIEESQPEDGSAPIEWLLLTTLDIPSLERAIEVVGWYAVRWLIEMFHKTLKSGCHIEKRQFESFDNFCRYLALDSIVAWRLLYMTLLARATPHTPCTVVLEDLEWQALYMITHHRPIPLGFLPSIAQAVLWIAQLGGYLNRKNDGPPGTIVLWRGFSRLQDSANALNTFRLVGNG